MRLCVCVGGWGEKDNLEQQRDSSQVHWFSKKLLQNNNYIVLKTLGEMEFNLFVFPVFVSLIYIVVGTFTYFSVFQ